MREQARAGSPLSRQLMEDMKTTLIGKGMKVGHAQRLIFSLRDRY